MGRGRGIGEEEDEMRVVLNMYIYSIAIYFLFQCNVKSRTIRGNNNIINGPIKHEEYINKTFFLSLLKTLFLCIVISVKDHLL